ncbi:hypothetical protein DL766_009009 [Monosporascus sp. MC13-8B]|uniref:ATP synthase mitochondrial F1 complex assembly factor 2 n=1 Tax=Monosporascus cannonballus TaxID=155416 RepID=A0ABY0GVK5_9PEZI|nr:hypothetical protein DL762_008764 [Monosporascus cannonballus]RYO88114.1 hypothetical protein DL763_006137 [Monosporascus cannonballus]RYP16893.1 hypothetical protein DL766_009009 [Monosporascus sp. MC13-8B]
MKPPTRIALRRLAANRRTLSISPSSSSPLPRLLLRPIHGTPPAPATVSPVHGQGPPPDPPQPTADSEQARLERRRKQAELLQRARDARTAGVAEKQSPTNPPSRPSNSGDKTNTKTPLLRKRFWKDVHVREVDGAWQVHLDARPLRHPATKRIVRLPLSKPLLAGALALEWDLIVSAQQATRQHMIPLTSLVCRAIDIREDDEAREGISNSNSSSGSSSNVDEGIRRSIVRTVLRYLDTDSLLCWAPPPQRGTDELEGPSLRDAQRSAAERVIGFLSARVWPGVEIEPVLDGESILPRGQKPGTRQVIEGWVSGLDAWELAGLERAVLAGKGLLAAVRLLAEWSEGHVGVGTGAAAETGDGGEKERKFGVEEAARLASIEVDWQTRQWGEVEDTHDVEREDLRRQLGSVVLLVSGTGTR